VALTFQPCKPQIRHAFKRFQRDKLLKLSLRTSWVSLALDAPPDKELAHFVRLRSRGRYARPAGAVDDLIRQSQARQRTAAQTRRRSPIKSVGEDAEEERDHTGAEAGSVRRHKKRGSGGQRTQEEQAAPVHLHLMYREEEQQETPDA